MLDSLRLYLETSTSPEFMNAITKAFELFEEYGLEDYEVGYEDILMTANNEGESEAAIKIGALTEEIQDSILGRMQIKVADEVTISEANTILEGIKGIEKTEFNQEILDICNDDQAPEEQLAEILQVVTGIDSERLVILFHEVSKAVIQNKIKPLVLQEVIEPHTVIDSNADAVLMARFLMYREAMDNQPLFMHDMLMNGVPLRAPYASYHEKIMSAIEIQQTNDPMPIRLRQIKTAVQLCGAIIVASDTQDANWRNLVKEELSKTYTDIDIVTPIYLEIDSIMVKFHQLEMSGTKRGGGVEHEEA